MLKSHAPSLQVHMVVDDMVVGLSKTAGVSVCVCVCVYVSL